jgi:NNP family nitrate/nitrite transporter-like MFS transporter
MARWQFAISAGAVVIPAGMGFLLAAATVHWGAAQGWRAILACVAPLFLLLMLTVPGRRLTRTAQVAVTRLRHLIAALGSPGLAMVLALAMLHVAGDNSAYFWIVLMVKQRFGAGAAASGLLITGYGASYAAARALRGAVRWPWAPLPTIAVGSGVGAALLILATRAPTLAAVICLYIAAGLMFSLNWPSLLGYAGDRFPRQLGVVLGTLGAVTGAATLVVSSAAGVVSRLTGKVSLGMLVPVGCFAALSVLAVVAWHALSRAAPGDVEENGQPTS